MRLGLTPARLGHQPGHVETGQPLARFLGVGPGFRQLPCLQRLLSQSQPGFGLVADGLLTGTFSGQSQEERARCSLRTALHQLRLSLAPLLGGRDPVARSRKLRTVALAAPRVLDVELFEQHFRQGEALAATRPAEALRALQQALALYRGELLEGCEEEWVHAPRAHYADLQVQALHLAARCQLALCDGAGAERSARRALALDSWRESLHEDLIEALVVQGRRGEALRHYRQAAAEFGTELGVVPGSLHSIYDAHLGLASQLALAS